MDGESRREKKLKRTCKFLVFTGFLAFSFFVFSFVKNSRAASPPNIITYQGKLLQSNYLATTTQNMYFILYDAASGGNALYSASGTVGSPNFVALLPVKGLFTVNLGGSGTNNLDPELFKNYGTVYLEVRVGADTLSPRKQITAAPYAFNAKYLDGVGTNTVSSTVYIPVSDGSGNFAFRSTTITTSTIANFISSNVSITGGSIAGITDLALADGGTNASLTAVAGGVVYSTASALAISSTGTAGWLLLSGGTGAPTWVNSTTIMAGGGWTDDGT
ncbi:hypothetical protein EPN28_00250, partial [Patescibacteria group bacterium]